MLSTLASMRYCPRRARHVRQVPADRKEYKDLLHCKTVGEIAAYLKQRTAYGPILTGVNEKRCTAVSSRRCFTKNCSTIFAALSRYEITVGEHFADYLLARSEIDQILHSLMLLMGGRSVIICSVCCFWTLHHIDLTALSKQRAMTTFYRPSRARPIRACCPLPAQAGQTARHGGD